MPETAGWSAMECSTPSSATIFLWRTHRPEATRSAASDVLRTNKSPGTLRVSGLSFDRRQMACNTCLRAVRACSRLPIKFGSGRLVKVERRNHQIIACLHPLSLRPSLAHWLSCALNGSGASRSVAKVVPPFSLRIDRITTALDLNQSGQRKTNPTRGRLCQPLIFHASVAHQRTCRH